MFHAWAIRIGIRLNVDCIDNSRIDNRWNTVYDEVNLWLNGNEINILKNDWMT